MNVLKRPYEGDLAAVWAYLDLVKDVCEGDLAVVLGASDQRQMLCHAAARVWVQPKEWERPYTQAIPKHSRYESWASSISAVQLIH